MAYDYPRVNLRQMVIGCGMDLAEALAAIGFTEYEAKVYMALLGHSPATGYQISKQSGVPRSMVYETLRRLYGRGAVLETVEERATLYRPLAPHLLLDRHELEHRRLVSRLRSGLEELYEAVDDDRVWTITGAPAVFTYASRMFRDAISELYLVVDDHALDKLRDEIEGAHARGVDLNTLLTGKGTLKAGRVAHHPPLESELQELTGSLIAAADRSEVLIASTGTDRELSATITRSPDLVLIARQFVWMELFAQRIYARLGNDLLARLSAEDRAIFESLSE